jgi:hypothetical protein
VDEAPARVVTGETESDEGPRLVDAAEAAGVPLRLIGGTAVFVRCPSARRPELARSYGDVDVIGLSSARPEITDFLEAQGYVQDRMFNALHGAQRLNFTDPVRHRPLDVILDRFAMCHTIDLRERLTLEPRTIPLSDLLLTKLQVVEQNDKDVRDLLALLIDHGADSGPNGFETRYLVQVLGDDWGFEHTVRLNLARLHGEAGNYRLPAEVVAAVRGRISELVAALDAGPKTLKWRLRAKLGARIRWYEDPEEGRR